MWCVSSRNTGGVLLLCMMSKSVAKGSPSTARSHNTQGSWIAIVPKDLESNSFYENDAIKFLNQDLEHLLGLRDTEFWRQVKASQSLHVALDSYLRCARRPHDVRENESRGNGQQPHSNHTQQLHKCELELSRRVFMVYYRLVLPDLEAGVQANERADTLYRHWIVDIPKILDVCAVYGDTNQDLVSKFVQNTFKLQPKYGDDLEQSLKMLTSNTEQVVQTILTSGEEYGDVMDHLLYLLDSLSTLCCFITAYGDYTGLLFTQEEGRGKDNDKREGSKKEPNHLAQFILHIHLIALPSVAMEMDIEGTQISGAFQKMQNKLEGVLMEAIKHCLRHNTAEENMVCVFDMLTQIRKLEEGQGLQLERSKSKLCLLEEKYQLSEELVIATKKGQLKMTKSQARQMDEMLSPALQVKNLFVQLLYPEKPEEEASGSGRPYNVLQEKQIETIKSILPDYGRGFIHSCLKYYDFNLDLTVSHMMEGSLPFELATLDSTLETPPPLDAASAEGESSSKMDTMRESFDAREELIPPVQGSSFTERGTASSAGKAEFTYYKKRDGKDNDETFNGLERDIVVRDKILNMYEDDYDDSIDFTDTAGKHEIDDLEGLSSGDNSGGGGGPLPQGNSSNEARRIFWVQDNKVYNYAKPGATKVSASNAPNALVVARQVEAEEDKAARKKAREDKLVKDDPGSKSKAGGRRTYHRKEKKKAHIGNHNRKAKALRKQGM